TEIPSIDTLNFPSSAISLCFFKYLTLCLFMVLQSSMVPHNVQDQSCALAPPADGCHAIQSHTRNDGLQLLPATLPRPPMGKSYFLQYFSEYATISRCLPSTLYPSLCCTTPFPSSLFLHGT